MAKVGFWLNGSKGKLAGATMYKDKNSGETIIREVVTPSNPKTSLQIIQRIVMHTVALAYSTLKAICDHSFEGMSAGRDTMGYFVKQNVQICREAIARMQSQAVDFYDMYNFVPLGFKQFVPNQYQISMGSLPNIPCGFNDEDVEVVANFPAGTANTYQGIIDAYGLNRGDQLTFMVVEYRGGVRTLAFARVILDPTDPTTHLPLGLETPFIAQHAVNCPSIRNEGNVYLTDDLANGRLLFRINAGVVNHAGCIIVSRKGSDDSWMRSTTYLAYRDNTDYSLGECMDRAAQGANTIYTPNEYYLNNAGQGGGVAAETGEGSDAGTGGGEAPAISVTSASVNASNITLGSLKTVSQTGENPEAITVAVNMTNAQGVNVKVLDNAGDSQVATGAVNAEGVASMNFTPVYGHTYRIVYNNGAEDVATGYTFEVVKMGGTGEE